MSSDEQIETREAETDDVEAHEYVPEERGGGYERKRKEQYEEPVDPDGGDLGRRGQ